VNKNENYKKSSFLCCMLHVKLLFTSWWKFALLHNFFLVSFSHLHLPQSVQKTFFIKWYVAVREPERLKRPLKTRIGRWVWVGRMGRYYIRYYYCYLVWLGLILTLMHAHTHTSFQLSSSSSSLWWVGRSAREYKFFLLFFIRFIIIALLKVDGQRSGCFVLSHSQIKF
jgi:hypothetical protein